MKIYKGYQFRGAVEELIHKIAKHYDTRVSVAWTSGISTAGINKRGEIMICNVRDDAVMNQRDLLRWVGYGVHELLHRLYTDFDARGDNRYEDAIHNAIEDAWIEHTGIRNNLTGNVSNLLSELIGIMVDESMDIVTDWSDPGQYPFVLAVYLRDHAKRKVPLADGLEPIFKEAKRRLNKARNSYDTLSIAKWVVSQLTKLDDPAQQQPQKAQIEPQSGDQEGGDGEGAGSTESGDIEAVGKAKSPSMVRHIHDPEPRLDPASKGADGTYSTGYIVKRPNLTGQAWTEINPAVPARLRYEVKRLFDNSGIDEFQRNRRSGSINLHALPSHSYNNKLFKLRRVAEGIDTAVVIVIDASGSMFSDGGYTKNGQPARIHNAVQTCGALLDTLKRAQVATAIVAFGDHTCTLKPFDMPIAKSVQILSRIDNAGGTNDYIAVRHAHTLLLNRPEARKICFVITDGEGDYNTTKEQCLAAERLGVTTIGIGIELDVSGTYPQSVTVRDTDDLAKVSFNRMKLAA